MSVKRTSIVSRRSHARGPSTLIARASKSITVLSWASMSGESVWPASPKLPCRSSWAPER